MGVWAYFLSAKEARGIEASMQRDLEALRGFRKEGEKFVYLGRTCIVRCHQRFAGVLGWVPELRADYADEMGVIHTLHFRASDLPVLRRQNEAERPGSPARSDGCIL